MITQRPNRPTRPLRTIRLVACSLVLGSGLWAWPTQAQSDGRPYDTQLFTLSETLGGIHYLRALCGNSDGQSWRAHMQGLIDAEGFSALRRAVLARRFNQGYRNYNRTYRTCTVTAQAALKRFIEDAEKAATEMLATVRPAD